MRTLSRFIIVGNINTTESLQKNRQQFASSRKRPPRLGPGSCLECTSILIVLFLDLPCDLLLSTVPLLVAVILLSILCESHGSGGGGGPMSPSTLPQVQGGDGGGGTLESGEMLWMPMGGGCSRVDWNYNSYKFLWLVKINRSSAAVAVHSNPFSKTHLPKLPVSKQWAGINKSYDNFRQSLAKYRVISVVVKNTIAIELTFSFFLLYSV